jgi:hypothetical protein
MHVKKSYGVPIQVSVIRVCSCPKSLDKPKSASFGLILTSNNILAGFKSK